jgi:membrane protein DedA with SNARE-associated domain
MGNWTRSVARVVLTAAGGACVVIGAVCIGYAVVFVQARMFALFDPIVVGVVGIVMVLLGGALVVVSRRRLRNE